MARERPVEKAAGVVPRVERLTFVTRVRRRAKFPSDSEREQKRDGRGERGSEREKERERERERERRVVSLLARQRI